MKKFIAYCLSHPVSIDMFMILIVLIGIVSLYNLNVEILPVFDVPFVSIRVDTDDVSVLELEENVTIPLQRELSALSGLRHIRSYTSSNQALLQLEFQWGIKRNELLFDISSKIDKVSAFLPDYAGRPEIFLADPSARPIAVYAVCIEGQRENFNAVFESSIRQLFLQNKDIANFVYYGRFINEFNIILDINKLNVLDIDYMDIRRSIDNALYSPPISSYLLDNENRYFIRIDPLINDINSIRSLQIKIGDNIFTGLSNIAEFTYSDVKNRGDIYLDGKEIVLCEIYSRYGSNPVSIIGDIDSRIALWNENNDIKITKLEDNSNLVIESIYDIMINALIGGLIAFLVLFLFFSEIKYPLILMLSMPFSILIAFLFFFAGGISLNIISIGGLSIGIGLLVDNSVVVLENILRYRKDRAGAVYEVFYPLLAGTVTTVIVFFPVIYLKGLIGTFFIQQAMAITIALLASLFTAFFIIPSLFSREISAPYLKIPIYTQINNKNIILDIYSYVITFLNYAFIFAFFIVKSAFFYSATGIFKLLDIVFKPFAEKMVLFWDSVEKSYLISLKYFIKHKNIVIILFLLFFLFNLYFIMNTERVFIPEIPSDIIIIEAVLPVGTSAEHSRMLCNDIAGSIKDFKEIKSIEVHIGEEWTGTQNRRFNSSSNYLKIYLKEEFARDITKQRHLISSLAHRLDRFSGAAVSIQGVESVYGDIFSFGQYPFEINLYHDDAEQLLNLTGKLFSRLRDSGYFSDITADAVLNAPLYRLRINEDMIRAHDLNRAEIINTIRMVLSGQDLDIDLEMDWVNISVRLDSEDDANIEDFMDKIIRIDNKNFFIKELLSLTLESEPLSLQHFHPQRNTVIYARHHIEQTYSHVLGKAETLLQQFSQEHAVLYDITGENIRIKDAFSDLILAVVLAVILVYISLGVMLESYKLPVLIMAAVPMGLTGVFTGLFFTGRSINVFSILGIIVLVGICVNDSILKISKAENFIREGYSTESAIITASIHKWRPIIITSITTILGLFPLLFSQGKFAVLAQSLAFTVIMGLVFSTMLTLYIIPLLYIIFKQR